jgi:hypothetical protein
MKAITKSSEVTPEILAEWNAKHPTGVFELAVESGEYTGTKNNRIPIIKFRGWMRKPTRDEMRELTAKANGTDPVTYTEIVLDTLWLGGDEEIKTDDEAFYSVMPEVQKVLDIKAASLKKL